MALRSMIVAALVGALAAPLAAARGVPAGRRGAFQRAALDAVLAAYVGGDAGIVDRTFAQPRDFIDRLRLDEPRELEKWLGAWDPGKARFVLEIARAAARIAPRYTPVLITAGRAYLRSAPHRDAASSEQAAFAQLWHRIAIGLLEGTSDPWRIDEHLADLDRASGGSPPAMHDARVALARGVTQERRCWDARPSLDQPARQIDALSKAAGVVVPDDLDAPRKALRASKVTGHAACLKDALTLLEAAATSEDTRAEARVRAGWVLFQMGRFKDAIDSLESAQPGADRQLAYWRDLFRGRALAALDRPDEAATAYRAAVALFPSAQSAGIGLALSLMQADRDAEADEAGRALRASGGHALDPWVAYLDGDRRFVDGWLEQLRRIGR